ncbi:MAG: pseudaminic acid cytidylyltransferase [Methylococcaceae bacterium]|nr:pseudaminic acid cytidylyltransferase [Methylococcaceae bacterium]
MKVAIIPARGGSKRILRKNIKPFCGKPMIAYAIETAIASQLFDRVVVSTEDSEIAQVARQYGAETPFIRPMELANDIANTDEVLLHAIKQLMAGGVNISTVCCIYATTPFLSAEYLLEGYQTLMRHNSSFAFSVTTFPFPVQRAIRITKEGLVEALHPENNFVRSQDLEEIYHDAGQFYWGKVEAFLEERVVFSHESVPVILPRYLVQDIDTPEDWTRASYMFKAMQLQNNEMI